MTSFLTRSDGETSRPYSAAERPLRVDCGRWLKTAIGQEQPIALSIKTEVGYQDRPPHHQLVEFNLSERHRYQLSASVFVLLMKDRKICMLRRKGTGWMDGSFSVPAGGLDAGETIRDAAVREAHEEVGVCITPDELQYVHTLHSKTNDSAWVGHFFLTTTWGGTAVLREPEKHADLHWWPINELPSETIPYVRQAIQAVVAQKLYSEYGWD